MNRGGRGSARRRGSARGRGGARQRPSSQSRINDFQSSDSTGVVRQDYQSRGNRGGGQPPRGRGQSNRSRGHGERGNHRSSSESRSGRPPPRPNEDRTRRFGYRKLSELASEDKDPNAVVMELITARNGFQDLLRDDELSSKSDWMVLVMKLIGKASKSSHRQSIMELLTLINEEKFILVNLTPFLNDILAGNVSIAPDNVCGFINDVLVLIKGILQRMQTNMSSINLLFTVLDSLIREPRINVIISQIQPNIITDIEEIRSMREAIQDQINEKRKGDGQSKAEKRRAAMEHSQPPEDFRLLPILPALKDLQFFEKPFLRANKIKGGYKNLNHYLDVQFRLLREDYVQPLRNGIAEYRHQRAQGISSRKIQDIRLYEKVQIIRPMCTDRGILHMIQFDVSKMTRVRWESSRRLLYGSLICLSADDFETILFATVTNRDIKELSQGYVQVQFEQSVDKDDFELSSNESFMMAETTAYFEAYRHILEGLQEIPDDLPLQKYIVKCETTLKPPKYLLGNVQIYDFAPLNKGQPLHVPVINTMRWPTAEQLELDESQRKALQLAITREMAIIQGPPGTGKTFVGLKVVQLLLHNKSVWNDRATDPILVVCYTNHALDQFLSDISIFTDQIVRIGGRCSTESLEMFMLKNHRRKARENKSVSRTVHERKSDCRRKMVSCREKIERVSAMINAARSGVVRRDVLKDIMTPEHEKSLSRRFHNTEVKPADHLFVWLGIGSEIEKEEQMTSSNTSVMLEWKKELIEGNGIDSMTQEETKMVAQTDVWTFPLLERGSLYKTWLIDFQGNVNKKLKEETFSLQSLIRRGSDQHTIEAKKANIQYMTTQINKSRMQILSEQELMFYVPVETHSQFYSLLYRGPQTTVLPRTHTWLCLNPSVQNEGLISRALSDINDKCIDADEEAAAEDAERRLADDEQGEEEMAGKGDRKLDLEIMHTTLSGMSLTITDGQNQPGSETWQIQSMSKKRMEKEVRKILSVEKPMTNEEAYAIYDVWSLSPDQRRGLYRYWLDVYLKEQKISIEDTEEEYSNLCKSYKEATDAEDVEIMVGAEIIGMTTTGAAKYRKIIQQIQPKIIVVEEAAEVLESHIVTTINENCQHLILIGDHKQLRPTPTVYDLAMRYNLEISLFERMVKNEMNFTTLQIQHRMRPEISVLMKHIYSDLKDHPSVKKYDHVRGIVKDVYLINHNEPETSHDETKSKSNLHEAKFVSQLCRYLLQQGYDPHQITVLTTYTGQVLAIKKQMPKKDFEGVRITAVDNFQGEENDIILLSLVRSNAENSIGFLKIENRICVALSRARMGFYIVGNFKLLAQESTLWENMVSSMMEASCVGPFLTLQCQNHPTEETNVSKDTDFSKVPNGGCKRMCNYRLPCGHVCEQICHPEDREHEHYKCFKPCEKIVCSAGHKCMKKCYIKCGNCMTEVPKALPFCGHEHNVPCFMDPLTFVCTYPCGKILECGHQCKGKCGQCRKNGKHVICTEMRPRLLECGHRIEASCSVPIEKIDCTANCNTELQCGHICVGTCGECSRGKLHVPCQNKCGRSLICGHTCNQKCSEPCPPCKKNCDKKCEHSKCKKKCGDECDPCVEKCKWACDHQKCDQLCHEQCNRPPCFMPCKKKISCGCPCMGFCSEVCPQMCQKCSGEEFAKKTMHMKRGAEIRLVMLEDCMHIFEASFLDEYMSVDGTFDSTSVPVAMKKCPECSCLIQKSKRYRNIIKTTSRDINHVKQRMDGDRKANLRRRKNVIDNIQQVRLHDGEAADSLLGNRELKSSADDKTINTQSLDHLENQVEILHAVFQSFSLMRGILPNGHKHEPYVAKALLHLRNWTLKESFLPSKNAKNFKKRWRQSFTKQELEEVQQEITRLNFYIKFACVAEKMKVDPVRYDSCLQIAEKTLKLLDKKLSSKDEATVNGIGQLLEKKDPAFDLASRQNLQLTESKGAAEEGSWYKCIRGKGQF